MTESTTIEAPRTRLGTTAIAVEDDATPLVRLIAGTLERGGERGLADLAGSVLVRSHDTPQAATVSFARGAVEITAGASAEPDATLVVDLYARFAQVQEPDGDAVLAAGALHALTPPVPHWREAAARFWAETREIPGIPDVLVVHAVVPDGDEHARFGDGRTTYGITGPADLLAGVFSGADDLLASLTAGVQVQGTLAQLSVMTAASWKARFDV